MGRYRALLVANSKFYADPERLPELKAPIYDMARLHDALIHPDLGLFDREHVRLLPNARSSDVLLSMEDFFQSGEPEDTLLLYYSGHGLLDINNNFFLCASDTRMDRLMATGIRDEQVNGMMRGSPARTFVLILDCCSSGAWKSPADLLPDALRGSGRFLLSSSRGGQNSGDAGVETESSAFTKLLVEAMEEADLDTDQDGYVDIDEIYKHVERNLRVTGQQAQRDFGKSARSVALARRPPVAIRSVPIATEPIGPHEPPTLTVTPEQLEVSARLDEVPLKERVYVFNRGGGTISWTAESDDPWIRLEPHDEFVRVSLSPAAEGPHRGSIYIREQRGMVKQVRVAVRVEEGGEDGRPPADGRDRVERGKREADHDRSRWKGLAGIGASLLALVVVIASVVVATRSPGSGTQGGSTNEGPGDRVRGERYLSWLPSVFDPGSDTSSIKGITPAVEHGDAIVATGGSVGLQAAVWLYRDGLWSQGHKGGDGSVNGIIGLKSGFIAVGETGSEVDRDAAVWTVSPLGEMERVVADVFTGSGVQTMEKAIPWERTGVIAAGRDGSDGAVWSWSGSGQWKEATGSEGGLGGEGDQVLLRVQKFEGVRKDGLKFIAVGYEQSLSDRDGAIWVAIDPSRWQRLSLPVSLGGPGDQVITDITGIDSGGFVAVGYSTTPRGDLEAAVWRSSDGRRWRRPTGNGVFGGPGDQLINRVISPEKPGLPCFIAGGYDEFERNRDAALWYSNDGSDWLKQRSIESTLGGPGEQEIFALHPLPPDLLAVGVDEGSGMQRAAIWKGSQSRLSC
jgi:hypothetical protein